MDFITYGWINVVVKYHKYWFYDEKKTFTITQPTYSYRISYIHIQTRYVGNRSTTDGSC